MQGDWWLNVDVKRKGKNWGEREKQSKRKGKIPADGCWVSQGRSLLNMAEFTPRAKSCHILGQGPRAHACVHVRVRV